MPAQVSPPGWLAVFQGPNVAHPLRRSQLAGRSGSFEPCCPGG